MENINEEDDKQFYENVKGNPQEYIENLQSLQDFFKRTNQMKEFDRLKEIEQKYERIMDKYNETRLKNIQSMKCYFQNTTKNIYKHCVTCDKKIKKNSYYNHVNNSKKHAEKLLDFKFSKDP